MKPRIFVIMGVAGSGKTTVGRLLASKLGCDFSDADEFHSPENIAKMSSGRPLTDSDRGPWLEAMRSAVRRWLDAHRYHVLACSALKSAYRRVLQAESDAVVFVYLKADRHVIAERLASREHHYMKANMVDSQFDALEEPLDTEALVVSAESDSTEIVERIVQGLAK